MELDLIHAAIRYCIECTNLERKELMLSQLVEYYTEVVFRSQKKNNRTS